MAIIRIRKERVEMDQRESIHVPNGCRSKIPTPAGIKSGMTELASLIAG